VIEQGKPAQSVLAPQRGFVHVRLHQGRLDGLTIRV
jgi:hypothetical protein